MRRSRRSRDDWPMPVAIRVNGVGTEWHSLDLDAVARSKADFVVVPRAISAHLVRGVAEAVGKPVLAMIETAAGVLAAPEIAADCAALIAGTNDLRADLRLPLDATREPISASLQMIVLAGASCGSRGVRRRVQQPRRCGWLPARGEGRPAPRLRRQEPDPSQPDRAVPPGLRAERRPRSTARGALVEAFHGGAERFENEMIERMHVEAAQRVLARARRLAPLGELRLACHGPIWPNSTTPPTFPSD